MTGTIDQHSLNPQVLMIGGDLPQAQDHFMAALRARRHQRTQPLATRELQVLTSALGEHSGIFGAAKLVVDEVFPAESVDRMLQADGWHPRRLRTLVGRRRER